MLDRPRLADTGRHCRLELHALDGCGSSSVGLARNGRVGNRRRRGFGVPMRERRRRARREHDEHDGAERELRNLSGFEDREEQQHGDEAARRDPRQDPLVALPQQLQDREAGDENDAEHRGRDRPRGPRAHRAEVGQVAQDEEEETLGGKRELRHQSLELPERLVVALAAHRGQLAAPVAEVRIVEQEPTAQHEDERGQVQRLARGVHEHEAGDERQEPDVAFEAIDEDEDRRGDDQRDRQRNDTAAEEVDREVLQRAVGGKPRVKNQHADDVGKRALVDDELARHFREPGGAGDRDGAADDRERDCHENRGGRRQFERGDEERGEHRQGHHKSQKGRRHRDRDQPRPLARHGEVERALEHDQDQPERAQYLDHGLEPREIDPKWRERQPQRDPGGDQEHDARQPVAPAHDVDEVREQQQPGGGEDRGFGDRHFAGRRGRASATESGSCRRRPARRPAAARRSAESRSTTRPGGASPSARASRARCRSSRPPRTWRPRRRGSTPRCRS